MNEYDFSDKNVAFDDCTNMVGVSIHKNQFGKKKIEKPKQMQTPR